MTGSDLRVIRKAAGLTQAQLAERWGCDKRTIGRYEMADALPGIIQDATLGLRVEAAGLTLVNRGLVP